MKHIVEKVFKRSGLDCVVLAVDTGHRCGYVGVPKSHPLYGRHYFETLSDNSDVEICSNIDIHGGLTFSSDGHGGYPVAKDDVWWFGFDCAHFGDSADIDIMKKFNVPDDYARMLDFVHKKLAEKSGERSTVKTLDFCVRQCAKLAKQLRFLNEGEDHENIDKSL